MPSAQTVAVVWIQPPGKAQVRSGEMALKYEGPGSSRARGLIALEMMMH